MPGASHVLSPGYMGFKKKEESVVQLTEAKENSLVRGWDPEAKPGDENQQGADQVDAQLKD